MTAHKPTRLGLTRSTRLVATLISGLCLAAGLVNTHAANKTWDGGGDGSSWSSSPANWVGDTAPVANDLLFFDGSTGLTPNNDFAANTAFGGITFNTNAGAFSMSGNAVNLAGGITNSSYNTQTISFNLNNNGANRVYEADFAPLICNGVISGNSVIKEGTNSLTLSGSAGNSSDGAIINNGMLILGKSSGNAIGNTVLVNTNGALRTIGPGTDQIHFNQRIIMNGGVFQLQHVNSTTATALEEIASLSGSNLSSIVECGLPASTNRLDIGGGNGHRGIYSGTIRDGAAGVLALQVYRGNNFEQLNGTNTYSGVTLLNNSQAAGAVRLIVNGAHIGGGAYTVVGSATDSSRVASLHGSGVISASVINFNANSFLSPGGILSTDLNDSATFSDTTAILTISNAVNLNTSSSSLEVQINGATAGSTYDQVVIAGSGTFSNNNANLRLTLGYTPAQGDKLTLVQVEGTNSASTIGTFASFNGVPTSMAQGATIVDPNTGQSFRISYRAEGSTFDMGAGKGNDIMLQAISPVGGALLTWRGDASPDWDITTSANWRSTNGVATTFTNADFVTFDNTGSNRFPVNLTTDLTPATVTVSATNNYEFGGAGKLTGLVIITKTNTGKLTITTDNDNSGATLLRQGTIQIGTNGTTGRLSGNVNMGTNTTLIFNRSDSATFAGVISGTGTLVNNSTNGTLILTADSPFNGGVQANAGTLQFGDGTGVSGSVVGRVTNNATVAYVFNNSIAINNSLSGTGVVNLVNTSSSSKRFSMGAGPTSLTNNTFSGWFDVGPLVNLGTPDGSSGTNQLGVGSTVYVEDTGSVLLDRNGIYPSTFLIQGAGNGSGNAGIMTLELEQGTTISGNVILLSDATIGGFLGTTRISGRIVGTNGTETLTFANRRSGATTYNLQIGSSSGPNNWGPTILEPGDFVSQQIRVTAMAPRSISTNALTIGAHGIFQLNGFDHTVMSLASLGTDGAFVPSVFNSSASTLAVFSVGTDGTSTTFDGVFGDGGTAPLGVTKVGAGTLTLTGTGSNTGPVTVSGGSIALSGEGAFSNATQIAIGSGATLDVMGRADQTLTLNNGQTLKGNGTLNGSLIAAAGSVVSPGDAIGTLTVANNATLGGTLQFKVNRTSAPSNCSHINVSGTLTAGGALTVSNIGPALVAGDKFQLFASAKSGFTWVPFTYDGVNAVQYTWQNNVPADGSVTVLSVTPILATTLKASLAGTNLAFSWTGPFKLLSQTNSTGIRTTWYDYPGGSSSPVNVPIIRTNPPVFFRLGL